VLDHGRTLDTARRARQCASTSETEQARPSSLFVSSHQLTLCSAHFSQDKENALPSADADLANPKKRTRVAEPAHAAQAAAVLSPKSNNQRAAPKKAARPVAARKVVESVRDSTDSALSSVTTIVKKTGKQMAPRTIAPTMKTSTATAAASPKKSGIKAALSSLTGSKRRAAAAAAAAAAAVTSASEISAAAGAPVTAGGRVLRKRG
jgi:hypothetical protein